MFWSLLQSCSQLEQILDKQNATLQEILDEEDVVSEFKGNNQRLVTFITQPSNMEQLFRYILTPRTDFSPACTNKEIIKFPSIAADILSADVTTLSELLLTDEQYIRQLFDFLCQKGFIDCICANFALKVFSTLLERHGERMLHVFTQDFNIVDILLDHICTPAVCDLFYHFVRSINPPSTRKQIVSWLHSQNFLSRMLEKFTNSKADPELQRNIIQCLTVLLIIWRYQANNDTALGSLLVEENSAMEDQQSTNHVLLNELESFTFLESILRTSFEADVSSVTISQVLVLFQHLLDHRRNDEFVLTSGVTIGENFSARAHAVSSTLQALTHFLPQLLDVLQILRPSDVHISHMKNNEVVSLPTTFGPLQPPVGMCRLQVIHCLQAAVSCCSMPNSIALSTVAFPSTRSTSPTLSNCDSPPPTARGEKTSSGDQFNRANQSVENQCAVPNGGENVTCLNTPPSPTTTSSTPPPPPSSSSSSSSITNNNDEDNNNNDEDNDATVPDPSTTAKHLDRNVHDTFIKEMHRLNFLRVVTNLFFYYQWNSFLHKAFENLILTVLRGGLQSKCSPLIYQLICSNGFAQQILDVWYINEEMFKEKKVYKCGYMGHIREIANALDANIFQQDSPLFKDLGDLDKNWKEFASASLVEVNRRNAVDAQVLNSLFTSNDDVDNNFQLQLDLPGQGSGQQEWMEYRKQEVVTDMCDTFGFTYDDVLEQTDFVDVYNPDKCFSIDMNITTEEDAGNASMFEQACNQEIRIFDDPIPQEANIINVLSGTELEDVLPPSCSSLSPPTAPPPPPPTEAANKVVPSSWSNKLHPVNQKSFRTIPTSHEDVVEIVEEETVTEEHAGDQKESNRTSFEAFCEDLAVRPKSSLSRLTTDPPRWSLSKEDTNEKDSVPPTLPPRLPSTHNTPTSTIRLPHITLRTNTGKPPAPLPPFTSAPTASSLSTSLTSSLNLLEQTDLSLSASLELDDDVETNQSNSREKVENSPKELPPSSNTLSNKVSLDIQSSNESSSPPAIRHDIPGTIHLKAQNTTVSSPLPVVSNITNECNNSSGEDKTTTNTTTSFSSLLVTTNGDKDIVDPADIDIAVVHSSRPKVIKPVYQNKEDPDTVLPVCKENTAEDSAADSSVNGNSSAVKGKADTFQERTIYVGRKSWQRTKPPEQINNVEKLHTSSSNANDGQH